MKARFCVHSLQHVGSAMRILGLLFQVEFLYFGVFLAEQARWIIPVGQSPTHASFQTSGMFVVQVEGVAEFAKWYVFHCLTSSDCRDKTDSWWGSLVFLSCESPPVVAKRDVRGKPCRSKLIKRSHSAKYSQKSYYYLLCHIFSLNQNPAIVFNQHIRVI